MAYGVTIAVGSDEPIHADIGGNDRLGTIVFAHGSGSSRHSPRNRQVADVLEGAGFATVMLDLLTESEGLQDLQTREYRFDISLLTDRVIAAIEWMRDQGVAGPIGLFGASTGAAAALRAAAARPDDVEAVVSRGGRPDMADEALAAVRAPTLLIVGGDDLQVLDLNERALAELNAESSLEVIPGASHLFEEPGKLELVAELASDWFRGHLSSTS
jgi:putative phosphoribosyl transferase